MTRARGLLGILLASTMTWPANAFVKDGGLLTAIEGQVQARTTQVPAWHPAVARTVYAAGDALMTNRRSRAEIAFADGTVTRLAPVSLLQIPVTRQDGFMRVLLGRLWLKVAKQHSPMAIKTPSAVATVVGTELTVSVDGEDTTTVGCLEGRVDVQGLSGPVMTLKPGEQTTVRFGGTPEKPVNLNVTQVRSADSLFKPVVAVKPPADDDPEGYRTLLRTMHENQPAVTVPKPPTVTDKGTNAPGPDEQVLPEPAPQEKRSDL